MKMNYKMNQEFQMAVKEYRARNNVHTEGYYKLPRFLFDEEFRDMTVTAKLLYTMMLERDKISEMNSWRDASGRTYIYFTTKEIANCLGVSMPTATSLLNELAGMDFIEKRNQGQGKPSMIYVNKPYGTELYDN